MVAPISCAEETETAEFAAPSVTAASQEEIMGNVDADAIEETAGDENDDENELITCEADNDADPELCREESMEDASVFESVDGFDFQD